MNLKYSLVGEANSRIARRKVCVADSKCLSNDIKALFARNRFKLNQCKGLKAIYDSLPFTKPDRRLSFISFLQLIPTDPGNKRFSETSEKSSCIRKLLQFMLHVKL